MEWSIHPCIPLPAAVGPWFLGSGRPQKHRAWQGTVVPSPLVRRTGLQTPWTQQRRTAWVFPLWINDGKDQMETKPSSTKNVGAAPLQRATENRQWKRRLLEVTVAPKHSC
ncbi:uncharacterized protein LOC143833680 [Paroedura picta]|uniref:uncharacterized protein LOC143833680 n=1 Tax=Paroedura picta TaxID=143630 RepID=UPI00405708B2